MTVVISRACTPPTNHCSNHTPLHTGDTPLHTGHTPLHTGHTRLQWREEYFYILNNGFLLKNALIIILDGTYYTLVHPEWNIREHYENLCCLSLSSQIHTYSPIPNIYYIQIWVCFVRLQDKGCVHRNEENPEQRSRLSHQKRGNGKWAPKRQVCASPNKRSGVHPGIPPQSAAPSTTRQP